MKDLLKLFGYTALVIVVGGTASIGGEVLTGTKWGGWIAGAAALCGILAIMFKLEKNGLCAVVRDTSVFVLALAVPVQGGATVVDGSEPGPAGPSWAELSPRPAGLSWAALKFRPAPPSFCSEFTSDETQAHCSRWAIVQAATVCAACIAGVVACKAALSQPAGWPGARLVCTGAVAACTTCVGLIPCAARQFWETAQEFLRWFNELEFGPAGCTEAGWNCRPDDIDEPH